jgi:putative endonuclease
MVKRDAPSLGPFVLAAGGAAEARALRYLQDQGLTLVTRNYRVAHGPSARAGEVDLVLRDRDGTLVFVEVRARAAGTHGGAAGSITAAKRRRVVYAARHYLMRLPQLCTAPGSRRRCRPAARTGVAVRATAPVSPRSAHQRDCGLVIGDRRRHRATKTASERACTP